MRRKVFTKPLPNLFATTILLSIFILQSHGKFDPLEPMTTGDTETFYIDSTKKTADVGRRCLVNANTYKVRKTKQNGNQLKFMAILGNHSAHAREHFIHTYSETYSAICLFVRLGADFPALFCKK